jgi:hypothetical protein
VYVICIQYLCKMFEFRRGRVWGVP